MNQPSSADNSICHHYRIEMPDELAGDAVLLGRKHGLETINQVVCFVLRWATREETITPDGELE